MRADFRLVRTDFTPERADFRPERADFRPERVDFRPERADFRPERAWGMNKLTNKSLLSSTGLCSLSPSGPLPKKKVTNILDDQRHPMLLNVNGHAEERGSSPMGTNGLCWCTGNQGAFYIPKLDLGLYLGTYKIERWNWGLGSEI